MAKNHVQIDHTKKSGLVNFVLKLILIGSCAFAAICTAVFVAGRLNKE